MNAHVLELPVHAKTADDTMRLLAALSRLAEQDPAFGVRRRAESDWVVLAGDSEAQLETAIDRLAREFKLDLDIGQPQVAFRETITRTIEYDHTHKKQAGGAGQFARLKLRFEPQPHGSGFIVANALAAGLLPNELVQAVETGLNAARETGVCAGYPTIGVKATLIDAAYHDADSTAQTFETAARACFVEGMAKAGPQLLEPIMRIEVTTPEEHMGDVIGDLNSRRATITGMDSSPPARIIHATVPLKEMFGYVNRLRALTQGRAEHTMAFDHYAPLPGGGDLDPVHPGAAIGLRIA